MSEYANPVCSEFYYGGVYNNSPISDMNSLNCMYRHEKNPENKSSDELFLPISKIGYNANPAVRTIKKRNTANKKERRRTQSINTAFSSLRGKIPNVPSDTKLSKIKTLNLAILYINYLVKVLDGEQDPKSGFQAELKVLNRRACTERKQRIENSSYISSKGRTGWSPNVWASELALDQS